MVVRDISRRFYRKSINFLAKEMYCKEYDGFVLRSIFPIIAVISVIAASVRLCYRVFSKVRIASFGENLVSAIFFLSVALMVLIGLVLFISKVKREDFEKELSFVIYALVERGILQEVRKGKVDIKTDINELMEVYKPNFVLSDLVRLQGLRYDDLIVIEENHYGVVVVDDIALRSYLSASNDSKYNYLKKILDNWVVTQYRLHVISK